MGILTNLLTGGVGELLKGAGSLAKDIRTAITGEEAIPPQLRIDLDTKIIELEGKIRDADTKLAEHQSNIIIAEAQGKSWLQRNWRPLLMLCIIGIVANNYILFPYLNLFFKKAIVLSLPDHLWSLLKIGVGGYIVGRSAEKVTEVLKK